ncbi:tetratricopeptide repeat protein [Winogradskyella eckloniae]|uniref:tetratricopeptide repeat protein n=1 Tax=Winogradskyella eckloniae TaxID=1089306 RepID=UPI00156486CD|nr:tetratricopeptide repeat protein [Winogradskyella eckloniae]NRD20526.1 tetratricopeptide repeat protein [Winogradskyella eckloniae]
MKTKSFLFLSILAVLFICCSGNVEYPETFKSETSGGYLYNEDDLIKVYYENDKLFLNWRGGKIEPVVLSQNEFFVADMYKKFKFVQHPKTKARYLSVISEDDPANTTYDYLKVPKGYKTPSLYLKEGNYDKALEGYLKIKAKDSTSHFIDEWDFNSMGYGYIRKHQYPKAIEILKINAALHPNSANVYDSLGEAYMLNGNDREAYINFKKTLEIYPENKKAKRFVKANKDKFEN